MAGAQAAHDHVERIGELGAERLPPPPAQEMKHQEGQDGAAEHAGDKRLDDVIADHISRPERHQGAERDDHQELGHTHRQA